MQENIETAWAFAQKYPDKVLYCSKYDTVKIAQTVNKVVNDEIDIINKQFRILLKMKIWESLEYHFKTYKISLGYVFQGRGSRIKNWVLGTLGIISGI